MTTYQFPRPHPSEAIAVGSRWAHNRTGYVTTVEYVTHTGVTFTTPTGQHVTFCTDFVARYSPAVEDCPHASVLTDGDPYGRCSYWCEDCDSKVEVIDQTDWDGDVSPRPIFG